MRNHHSQILQRATKIVYRITHLHTFLVVSTGMNAYARFDELSPFEGRLPDDLFEHLVLLGEIVVPHTVCSGLAGQERRNRLEILWVQRIPDKQHVSFGCCEILCLLFTENGFLPVGPDVGDFGCAVDCHGVLYETIGTIEGQSLLWSSEHHRRDEGVGPATTSRGLFLFKQLAHDLTQLQVRANNSEPTLVNSRHTQAARGEE